MSKLLFINPLSRLDEVPHHIPFGVSILANIADQLGHQVGILDFNALRQVSTPDGIKAAITEDEWDFIGITGLHSQYKEVHKIVPIARKVCPDAIIAGGGGYMTHLPVETMKLNPEIDIGCIGEGEITFREILDRIDSQRWSQVDGLIYREDGELILTEPRAQIQDLDTVPYPSYEILDQAPRPSLLDIYFQFSPIMLSPESMMSRRRMSFTWERGCPRQCRFCSHQGMSRWDDLILYGKDKVAEMDKVQRVLPARWPSPKHCVENVKMVRLRYGIDFATILDENMLSNRKWTEEFCNAYMDEGLHEVVPWGSLGDAPSVAAHPELIRTLRDAGCKYISYGFESASDRVLNNDIGKGQTQKMEQAAVDAMIKNGLNPIATFMLGNPHEDVNDILETVYFWIRNRIQVDPFICFVPGTTVKANPSSKAIESLQVGEMVQTHSNRWLPVLERFERHYDGELTVIKAGDLPVKLTPNHPVYAILRSKRYKDSRDKKTYPDETIEEVVSSSLPSWVRADGLKVGDIVVRPIDRTTEDLEYVELKASEYNWRQKAKTLSCDGNLMRLLGYYLSEGCIAYRENRPEGLLFSFNIKERELISDVKAIAGKMGLAVYEYPNEENSSVQVAIWFAPLARWVLKNFEEYASGKRIPHWAMRLPLDKQGELVRGYFGGDGHIGKNSYEITSVNEDLLRQVRDILLRFDIFGRIQQAKPETRSMIRNRIARFRETFRLRITGQHMRKFAGIIGVPNPFWAKSIKTSVVKGDFLYVPIGQVSIEKYSGKVYNINVEEDHSYVVERLGIVKNCTPYPGSPYFETYRQQIIEQYDVGLKIIRERSLAVPPEQLEKMKLEALHKFLLELDDAYDLTAHVSQVFDYGDLLALKSLMKAKDMPRILHLAHMRNWKHDGKWTQWCPDCKAEKSLAPKVSVHIPP